MNKWQAQIRIDGMNRLIGYYENEEEAAVDYARAVFKYKKREDSFIIDLSDVPPQPPIPKSSGTIKEGASKYTGVHFNKQMNKWRVQIDIKGKLQTIGYYENEEEAATDYARAVFKYKGQAALDKARERRALDNAREQDSIIIDLSGNALKEAALVWFDPRLLCDPQQYMRAGQATTPRFQCGVILM
ncbi:hypothetical protein QTG54_009673 [Skeletonema marinoi]|uniref:AP2/ERF domain-containing protein n=1 Tax=Skeletonema marinoi TaxID=267567 RepID=A0AAD8Y570_9STRA|nr:hypothetical protein QTG54_009673 [Skeletonema marinoi]